MDLQRKDEEARWWAVESDSCRQTQRNDIQSFMGGVKYAVKVSASQRWWESGDLCRGKQAPGSRASSGHRPGKLQLTSPQRWVYPTLGLTACHHMPPFGGVSGSDIFWKDCLWKEPTWIQEEASQRLGLRWNKRGKERDSRKGVCILSFCSLSPVTWSVLLQPTLPAWLTSLKKWAKINSFFLRVILLRHFGLMNWLPIEKHIS